MIKFTQDDFKLFCDEYKKGNNIHILRSKNHIKNMILCVVKKLLVCLLVLCLGSVVHAAKFIMAESAAYTVSGNVITITLSDESGWSVQNLGASNLYVNTGGSTPAALGTAGSIKVLPSALLSLPEPSKILKMISDGTVTASVRVYR